MPRLPGLNYGTPLTIDDLGYLETVYTDEFRNRLLATIGNYRSSGAAFGILSASDPINALNTTDPFFVQQNANDPMRIDVYPGVCFTESGMRVELPATISSVEMARSTVGSQNVVFVEHAIVEDEDTLTRTRYNTNEARRTKLAEPTSADPLERTRLNVVSVADWQNTALYPPNRKADIIVIAYVTVAAADNTAGKQVVVDLSRTNLTINRPWFSPVDIAHRAWVGTGSTDVPHNLGLNDLSQGDLSLYDQLVNYGMVLGRDQEVPGVPGALCFETVTPTRVKTDTNGTVTGTVSQPYIELTRFPVRLLGCYSLSDPDNEILVELIPHSNVLLLSQYDAIPTTGARVLFTTVEAGEPLTNSLISDELHVRQPNTEYELLIAGGRGHDEIEPKFLDQFNNARARISLGGAPGIPKLYRIVADATGNLVQTPQHLLCATKLDEIGLSVFTFETTMLGSARLRIGLQNVDLSAATVVSLRLTGTDTTGNTVTEDITFNFGSYSSPVIGNCYENARNFVVTDTVFATVSTLQVLSRISDGPATAVSVYADLDPMQTDALRDACPIAEVMWDGGRICRVQDVRPISSRLEVPTRTSVVELAAQTLLANLAVTSSTGTVQLLGDDLRDPHYFHIETPLRFLKYNDGLRSAGLPLQPLSESAGLGLTQDRYVSRAVRLSDGVGRSVHVALFGRDAQRELLNGTDGLSANLEYRWSTTGDPEVWIAWQEATALSGGNGANYRLDISDDTAFKIQLRLKGSVVGVSAVQYIQIGASQQISGTRYYTAAFSIGQTHKVAIPFGQSVASSNYRIVIVPYVQTDIFLPGNPGVPGLDVVHVEKFVDHAIVHLTRSEAVGSTTWTIDWMVDLAGYVTSGDGGFGDSIV